MLAAAGIAIAAVRRRRQPVVFAIAVIGFDLALTELGPFNHAIITVLLWAWVLYTLAAWTDRRIAVAGLAGLVGVFTVGQILGVNDMNIGQYAGVLFGVCVLWGCGYAMRSRRRMMRELVRISSQLAEEREDRARLAVASERSRIARELHAAIAGSVAAMVVQSEAATSRLGQDPRAAEAIMEAVEVTGRATLADMRRILGVLRRPGDIAEREPQPEIGQIHELIRRARASGQAVQFKIEGEPGTLSAGVEVGLYRILAEALATARVNRDRPVDVSLSFGAEQLELRVCADVDDWPTSAMHDCASICDGKLTVDRDPDGRFGLLARIATAPQGAFA